MRVLANKNKILILFLLFFNAQFSFGQSDYLYNQYNSLNFILNPAKVADDNNGVYIYWRNQWFGLKNNPKFYSASAHFSINKSIFIGAVISKNDYGGAFSSNFGQLLTTWRGKLSGECHFFSLGVGGKAGQLNSDFSDIILLDENDFEFPLSTINKNYFDLNAGFFYRYNFLKLGFSSNSLTGLLSDKIEFPYSKTINAELGVLLNKEKSKVSESEGITQINFRSRFNDSKILQVETIFDYYASSNYAIGCGFRVDLMKNMGNSILFHILINNKPLSIILI